MGRIKRKWNFDQSSTVNSREAFGKKKKNCIESFSNELFYEIFDYLNGYAIYQAFSNLNIRFENLVNDSSYSMKIQFSPNTIFDSHYEKFLHSKKHRFISFYFNNDCIFDHFLTYLPINIFFQNLQSIVLRQISTFQLLVLLFYLKSIPRLSSLQLYFDGCFCDLGEIYRIIFQLPALKYVLLVTPDPDCDQLDITLPTAFEGEFSSIEHLSIIHICKLNELINILSYTPRLSYLYCSNVYEFDAQMESQMSFKLSNLIHFKIHLFYVNFFEFEMFLMQLGSCLETLNLDILSPDDSYLDADRWEKFVVHHMPSLKNLIFDHTNFVDEDFQISSNYALISRFTSPFWTERKWLFKISLDRSQLSCSIHPYKKSWIDLPEDLEKCPIGQFSARDTLPTKEEEFLIEKIHPIFDAVQLNCLNIRCDEMSPQMFITILNHLPNLKAIRITGLPSREELHQDTDIFKDFLKNNKIIKLTLRNSLKKEQIDLILDLFPRIEYFSLQYIPNPEIESMVRCTLLKIQEKKISHPMTICIFGLDAEYDQVHRLKKMIEKENLLQNYTIHRRLNRFYLQWK